jgi:putrescine aminotransferase
VDRICKERNILLVADEVICGFGRTGKWFGSDYFNIKPDLMPFAKGVTSGYLPLGGLVVSDEIVQVLRDAKVELAHGYTYSAHPTCAAAAIANIELMHQTNIVDKVKNEVGPYLANKWKSLTDHPLVGEARSLGMLAAIEIVKDKDNFIRHKNAKEVAGICRDHCFANGLVMRAVGNKMIIAPPLVCTNSEIDEILEKVWQSLDMTATSIN